MARVATYLRVSSGEQSTDNQWPAMERWIADRGHELAEVYSEAESAWRSGHDNSQEPCNGCHHSLKQNIYLYIGLRLQSSYVTK